MRKARGKKNQKEKSGKNSGPLMSLPVNRKADAHANILAGTDSTTATSFIESAQIWARIDL